MRKYNLAIVFILILLTISVSAYFFYLDIIYKDKIIKNDVKQLSALNSIAKKSIIQYTDKKEMIKKVSEYNQIIQELNLDAIASQKKDELIIEGAIHNNLSYILLKKLLNIIKNDEVTLTNTCIGQNCTKDNYGFIIKFRPYLLKLK